MADPSETTQVARGPDEATELLAAIRALATQVGNLQAEVHELRTQARSLPSGEAETHGWEETAPIARESPAWMRTLDSPSARRPAVPRLLVEILFLAAVAVLAAIADFSWVTVVVLMIGAWGLVALAEWLAAGAARRREATLYGSLASLVPGFAEDPSWFAPPTEHTAFELADGDQSVTPLPPPRPE